MLNTIKGLFKNYIQSKAHCLREDSIILTDERKEGTEGEWEERKQGKGKERRLELLNPPFLPIFSSR